MPLTIGLINASLPSYFPQPHGVFEAARQMLDQLAERAVLAFRSIAATGGYDALAVSHWPALLDNPGMHPGAAFSWLEEKVQLPVASEGDVLGAVAQLVVKSLTGRVGCLLDMTSPDLACGQNLMWHGGGGRHRHHCHGTWA